MRICAYCRQARALTREHVIPAFLYRLHPDQKLGYNEKAERFMEHEALVRDVCRDCNSQALGSLDAYAKSFVVDNRLDRTFTKRSRLSIRYDYQPLLRWLLKLSYNAVRFSGHDPGYLPYCAEFILGSGVLPYREAVLLEVVQDALLPNEIEYQSVGGVTSSRRLSARRFRLGQLVGLPGELPDGQCRLIGLNAFYFYVALAPDDRSDNALGELVGALRSIAPQTFLLSPMKRIVHTRVSKRTILDAYKAQARKDMSAWLDYLGSGGSQ